ncbi:acyltransferase [Microbacteriaceae bacterium VKM Ac-2854]|nr:acyltransferase [Microbacteriaceae bacterium VKM Ac-2854]
MARRSAARRRSSSTSTRIARSKNSKIRLDIQGLRALAVTAVVFDHLLHWPRGGFVGVDVFFVVSGFLISGLLLREYERRGTISFVEFYRRRVRRIVPAATVVLAVTVAAGYALFLAGRAASVATDAVWGFLFAANWRFAISGTDYFAGTGATSPLQHFWSLSVEEQFYFVWPWLLLAILWVYASIRKSKEHGHANRIAGIVIGVITVASFAWALNESVNNPTVAYFSTFSRTWELGIGAILAASVPLLAKIPSALRPVLAYLGLAGIIGSMFLISTDSTFPAPWAALPVLSTALVISAGTGAPARFLWPLTNPVSRYIGDISYSIYLWHFPIVIFAAALIPEQTPLVVIGLLAAIAAVSVASYHLIEKPINTSPLLNRYPSSQLSREAWQGWRKANRALYTYGGTGVAAVLCLAIVIPAFAPRSTPDYIAAPVAAATPAVVVEGAGPVAATPAVDSIQASLTAALAATSWPELTPTLDELGPTAKVPEWVQDGCLGSEWKSQGTPEENAQRCVYGNPDGTKTAILVGDSVGISWLPAIRSALGDSEWKILVYTLQQCPATPVTVIKGDKSAHPQCDDFHAWTAARIAEIKPDLVIAGEAAGTVRRLASGAEGTASRNEMAAGYGQLIASVSPNAGQLLVLGPPVEGIQLTDCATAINGPGDCVSPIKGVHADVRQAWDNMIRESGATNVRFVDTLPLLCVTGQGCPAFADGIVEFADGLHLTGTYSSHLGPALNELLFPPSAAAAG